jgi:IclR family acetate operon transcriptional repressor
MRTSDDVSPTTPGPLERIVQVLEHVASLSSSDGMKQIHKQIDIPRSTLHRTLRTLEKVGFIATQDNGHLTIGDKLVRIALAGGSPSSVQSALHNSLERTATELGETVFLARMKHGQVEIVASAYPANPSHTYVNIIDGPRPAHACSSAKAILAFMPEDMVTTATECELTRYTKRTQTDPTELQKEFRIIRMNGYAECREEIEIGVSSIAVPLFLSNGEVIASVGVAGLTENLKRHDPHKLAESLRHVATFARGNLQNE